MPNPVNLDPTTLTPDQRVLIRCQKSRHPTMNTVEARFIGSHAQLFAFQINRVIFGAIAHDDGTLRDDEGLIVEVLSADA